METKEPTSKFYDVLPILLCGLSIPLSIFLWMGNLAFSFFATNPAYTQDGECWINEPNLQLPAVVSLIFMFLCTGTSTISPTRWLFSILVPVLLMLYGLKRKGVDKSGAALGLIIAITLSIASHAFLACLAAFFFTSSRATKYRSHLKRKIENDFKGGPWMLNDSSSWETETNFYDLYLQARADEIGSKCCATEVWPCNWLSSIYSTAEAVNGRLILAHSIDPVGWASVFSVHLLVVMAIPGPAKLVV